MAKRLFDIVGAAVLVVVLSPLALAVAATIWAIDGRPILFKQRRLGCGAKPFTLLKFRTMVESNDGEVISDAQRTTRFGHFLRRASLDELPQLFNVLRGDMSLVGPRPLLPEYLPYYSEREASRHHVRPGITGLAQANGRNCLPWDERLELDAQYVERVSFAGDMKIIAVTLKKVVGAEGVAVAGTTGGKLSDERRDPNWTGGNR